MFVAELTLVYGRYNELDNYTGWWLSHPSEKYYSVGVTIPNIWKNKKCSKPPPDINIAISKQIKKKSKTCKT